MNFPLLSDLAPFKGIALRRPGANLFFRPGGSAKSLLLYLALFAASFSVFFAAFYFRENLQLQLARLSAAAAEKGIQLHDMRLSGPIPALRISAVHLPLAGETLPLINVRALLHPLDGTVEITGETGGGTFVAVYAPESIASPLALPAELGLSGKNIALSALLANTALFAVSGGQADFQADLKLDRAGRNDALPVRMTGTCTVHMENAALEHSLPVLRKKTMEDIRGSALLEIEGNVLKVRSLELEERELACQVEGELVLKKVLPQSVPTLQGSLRADAELFETALLPASLASRLERDGSFRFAIGQSLARPAFTLQE